MTAYKENGERIRWGTGKILINRVIQRRALGGVSFKLKPEG